MNSRKKSSTAKTRQRSSARQQVSTEKKDGHPRLGDGWQAEKSALTRQAILEAAVRCFVKDGYSYDERDCTWKQAFYLKEGLPTSDLAYQAGSKVVAPETTMSDMMHYLHMFRQAFRAQREDGCNSC